MKYIKIVFLLFTISLAGMAITSCGNKSAKADTEKQGKEYTSAYICPMHCEGSGSSEPGTCPVCGMDYKKNEDHKSDGHSH